MPPRGAMDAYQDRCENVPFASIGGLDARTAPQRPAWVPDEEWPTYLAAYLTEAQAMFGEDWQTCTFGWVPAIRVEATNGR